jgi:hypothetical protein
MKKKEEEINEEWETIEADRPRIWNPAVDPNEAKTVEGTVMKIVKGEYGLQLVIMTEPNKEAITTPSHKLLQSKLEQINIGDYVRIEHVGIIKLKSGRKPENYSVQRRKKSD